MLLWPIIYNSLNDYAWWTNFVIELSALHIIASAGEKKSISTVMTEHWADLVSAAVSGVATLFA